MYLRMGYTNNQSRKPFNSKLYARPSRVSVGGGGGDGGGGGGGGGSGGYPPIRLFRTSRERTKDENSIKKKHKNEQHRAFEPFVYIIYTQTPADGGWTD